MTIPLFSRDAGHSLFIPKYRVAGGRRQAVGGKRRNLKQVNPITFCNGDLTQIQNVLPGKAGELNRKLALAAVILVEGSFPAASCSVPPGLIDKINNLASLNVVNWQPAAYEVFYVRS